jgi:hypothetical protein
MCVKPPDEARVVIRVDEHLDIHQAARLRAEIRFRR